MTRSRRLIATAAVASMLAGVAAISGTAHAEDLVARIDWSMPERTKIDSQGVVTNITPSRHYISPDKWKVTLNACGSSPNFMITNNHWDITLPDGVVQLDSPGFSCETAFEFPAEGSYPVTLTVTAGDGRVASTSRSVVVKDLLILSLGDSIASGEGNPDAHFPDGSVQWSDQRCHRSGRSGAAQAARRLETSDARTSVTFVSVACSGAGIQDGLIGQQNELTSQIEVAAGLLCPEGRTCNSKDDISQIDALVLQVGANDLHFDDVVFDCAFPTFGFKEDCNNDANVRLRLFNDIAALPGRLDLVAEVLNAWLRFSGVYVPDYFDPTRDNNGNICEDMEFIAPNRPNGHINRAEGTWAHDEVLVPLNNALVEASLEHGWSSLDFIVEQFATHGYCASDNWTIRYDQSLSFQGDHKGTMHPTEVGHRVYRDRLVQAIQPLLAS
jgi:hypothetical protein